MAVGGAVFAADHADGPAASLDKTADIADVFTWASTDGKTTYFVMDLGKDMTAGTKFSNTVKYVFHTASMPAYGGTATPMDIICTFDAAATQNASCWVGNKEYLTGSASAALSSADSKVKVFAGLRDDPFFFNLSGFQTVAAEVHAAATSATPPAFNLSGCPTLGATAQTLAAGLSHNASNGAPVNAFAAFNTLSIVLAVDTTLVTDGGPIVSVWASTNK
jgi:Domain of unknown function (DUF4331)